ncbi:MAG: hypothetical protein GY846_03720 [Deltaproteobacteria bacterium]|nr:hypothetical protein [Deltaproteobacteria bacterium]
MSAFETASKMIWNIRADTWEGFPMVEKLFATGEAISHLKYLEEKGVIKKTTEEGMHKYTRRRRHGQEN